MVPKKDMSCRRMVEQRPLNAATFPQIHITESPFIQTYKIPFNTYRTFAGAWYHSLSMDPESKDLTAFLTPWGRYPYLVDPQSKYISVEANTYQNENFLETQEHWVRCLDAFSMLDQDFADHFYHMVEFLYMIWN